MLDVSVRAAQQLLFPDPQPLVERLGLDFFRQLPERPGVYLMRDASDTVLYVGKAKNLRRRLGSYRVANPDRMPRRHLRLLRAVARVELQECPDESTALAREAELLRLLRPRFNRAGTWPATPRYLVWRCVEQRVHLAMVAAPDGNWQFHGPLGSGALVVRAVLARLLWFAVHPNLGFSALPLGWFQGSLQPEITLHCGPLIDSVACHVEQLLAGQPAAFCDWIRTLLPAGLSCFDMTTLGADLEFIADGVPIVTNRAHQPGQPGC